jgi:zinc transporter ZupT
MITLLLFTTISFLSFFFSTLIPLYFFKNGIQKSNLMLILGISAGILFGIATLDLIPEAIELTKEENKTIEKIEKNENQKFDKEGKEDVKEHQHTDGEEADLTSRIRLCMYGVASGMMTLALIGKLMSYFGMGHSHGSPQEPEYDKHSKFESDDSFKSFSFTAIAGLLVHSIIDGIVIGGTFSASQSIGSR